MSYSTNSPPLSSHKNKLLKTHILNVANISKQIFVDSQFKHSDLFADISFIIGLSHDFAKATSFFQEKLFNNTKTEKARHGFLSAVFGYYNIKNFFNEKSNSNEDNFIIISYLVILRHHGNLKRIDTINGEKNKLKTTFDDLEPQIEDLNKQRNNGKLKELYDFYKKYNIDIFDFLDNHSSLKKEIIRDLRKLISNDTISNYLNLAILYSALLDADKLDASETEPVSRKTIPSDAVDKFKKDKFNNENSFINQMREKAYDEVLSNIDRINPKDKIFSIELPTGCGKTLNSFSFSLKLREKIENTEGLTPRIVYSLPFLSIIDQNEKVIRDILESLNIYGSDYLLKHNYLSDFDYYTKDKDEEFSTNSSKILTEGWHSEIIITTFIQLFYSLISNKNRAFRKFHNIANSIIILDEIQSIPYKFWPIIRKILKNMAYKFNSWIVLITATQPLIFKENEDIIPLITDKKEYFKEFNRVLFKFDLEKKRFDYFKEEIYEVIDNNHNKDIMIVLNTINTSQELYHHIKKHIFENESLKHSNSENNGVKSFNGTDLIYLSTNIIPKHRLDRINHIKSSKNRKIIITTQLIEAGVDISVDIIYRDFAPLDSIIQTAGRCNREYNEEMGEVNVIYLINGKNKVFARFVYDNILLQSTERVIKDIKEIEEKDFSLYSKKYYEFLLEDGSQEDSSELSNILNTLNFQQIPQKFKLLDDKNTRKVDIYVIINDEAGKIWDKFLELENYGDSFDRKNKFTKFKSDFYKYVVSVDMSKVGSVLEYKWLGYISQDLIKEKYDLETGFIPEKDEEPFII